MLKIVQFGVLLCLLVVGCDQAPDSATDNTSDYEPDNTMSQSASDDVVQIEYIAHASFLLKNKGTTLLLDPFADTTWLSYYFPRDIEADAIFSTHPHYDHDGGIFRKLNPYWQGKIPFYQEPGNYIIGEFKITGVKGKHSEPYGKEFGQRNTIFLYDIAGIRFCHWGDNGSINDTLAPQLENIDVLMLPIDDTYHILKAEELVEIIDRLNPKLIIPMHYRIDALEPTPGKPKNLGHVTDYINAHNNVTRLKNNVHELKKNDLPDKQQYILFKHSPAVKNERI
jgi:L-ascorbate metabolism protein UlaG (beta-lactamase superfamily)